MAEGQSRCFEWVEEKTSGTPAFAGVTKEKCSPVMVHLRMRTLLLRSRNFWSEA